MKRKLTLIFLSIVCALCLCFGLTACDLFSNSSENDDSKQNTEQSENASDGSSGSSGTEESGGSGSGDSSSTEENEGSGSSSETEQTGGDEIDDTTTPISTYTVTYNANGGAFADGSDTYTQTVDSGSTLTAPTSPTREGCTFAGWTTSKNGSVTWSFSSDTVTSNITLYASWNEKTASILSVDNASIDGENIFMLVDSNDSLSLSSMVTCSSDSTWKLYYDELGQTEIPTRKTGTLTDGNNYFYIVVTSTDGTVVNSYALNVYLSYTVDINYYNGDELINTVTANTGYTFTTSYIPDITGYTFNKWLGEDGTEFTSATIWDSVNLTADKTANIYTVTYSVQSDETLSATEKTVTYDSDYTLAIPEKTGYTFAGWYYSTTQLTDGDGKSVAVWSYAKDLTVSANWTINRYAVTLRLSDSDAGSVKSYDNFTTNGETYKYNAYITITATTNSGYTWVGWYDSTGNLVTSETGYSFVLGAEDVSYTAKWSKTTLSINYSGAGNVASLTETYTIGDTVTITAGDTYLGYTWIGWYIGDALYTTEYSFTHTMNEKNITYTAHYELNNEMSNFIFTSTTTTCTITGINDDTVTEITVPDYVTSISSGSFNGCSNLTSITLPFVGSSASATSASSSTLFGYIFGTSSYDGGTSTKQNYASSSYTTYYIPATLTTVIITGGNILYGAFWNCTSLANITIGDSVETIGEYAFDYCSSLESVTV